MKRGYFLAFLAIIPLLFAAPPGGGRGDRDRGARFGGGGGGGPRQARTPSMSRNRGGMSQNKFNRQRPGGGGRPGMNRPGQGQGQRPGFSPGNRPGGNRPGQGQGNRPGQGQGNRPGQGQGNRPGFRPGNRPGNRPGGRPSINRPYNRPGAQNRRRQGRLQSRYVNNWQRRRHHRNWNNWYRRDRRWGSYAYWSTAPYWGFVTDWLPYGWSYPVYYDQGNVTVQINDYTPQDDYVDNEPIPEHPSVGEWLPLGLFVAAASVEEAAFSSLYVQLAVKKNGEIGGTYYNAATDKTEELVGVVDANTQQVAFQLASNPDGPLVVTGMYNLTQDVTPIQIQFPSGIEQDWVLVRIEDQPE